jgi:hypothetical protein
MSLLQTEQALADDKQGRVEAKERENQKESEAKQIKHDKYADNQQQKEGIKSELDTKKAAADEAYKNTST